MSRSEAEKVSDLALSIGVEGNPEQLADDALDAIMHGVEDDATRTVTEAAGIVWLTPHIWYREGRGIVDAALARTIIKQAREDKSWDKPVPDDDDKAVEEAREARRYGSGGL